MRSSILFVGRNVALIIFYCLIYFSCSDDPDIAGPEEDYLTEPACKEHFSGKEFDFQVVGFYPEWAESTLPISQIQWEKLTRIIYAFAFPEPDGSINTSELTNVKQLVDVAHSHGVEVYFSVGGGADSENFPSIATDPQARDRFVREIRQFIFENCLDGVDIDWEHWSGWLTNEVISEESEGLVTIVKNLQTELSPFGIGISMDLYASNWGGNSFFDDLQDYVDHFQVMAYDFSGPWTTPGPHSSYEDAIGTGSDVWSTGLAYWVNYRQWPEKRILLGVPFYGRDFDRQNGAGISYSDILDRYPDAWQYDRKDNIYYNGIETITRKTRYVVDEGYSGIMIWQLAQDHQTDSLSLLNAIYSVINP